MAAFYQCQNVSDAWYAGVAHLLSQDDRRFPHLILSVGNPLAEIPGVRNQVDHLFKEDGRATTTIERVADTLFPNDLYVPGESDAMEKFFERRAAAREFERELVPNGNYVDHLCEYPYSKGFFNQLAHVIGRLRTSRRLKHRNSNQCEIGVSCVSEELRIQTPGEHQDIIGFPCLSHISVTLADRAVCLAAQYRAQDFTTKAYGNLLGLGRLANFLAVESGFDVGEVLCIATGAILSTPPAGMSVLREVITDVGLTIRGSAEG